MRMKLPASIVIGAILAICSMALSQQAQVEVTGKGPTTEPSAVGSNPAAVVYVGAQQSDAEELKKLRQNVRERTGLIDVTPVAVKAVVSRLQEEREQLLLEAAGGAGRRLGLEEAVKKLSDQLAERVKSNPVVAQLNRVVEARQKQLDRYRELYKSGATAASEVDSAEANLASARAESATAMGQVMNESEAMDGWNRQVLELSIAERERASRLEYLDKRLGVFASVLDDLDQLETLQLRQNQVQVITRDGGGGIILHTESLPDASHR